MAPVVNHNKTENLIFPGIDVWFQWVNNVRVNE